MGGVPSVEVFLSKPVSALRVISCSRIFIRRPQDYLHSISAKGPSELVSEPIGYKIHTSLVRIDGNLNPDQYIADILSIVVVLYLRGLPNANFQQDNCKSHAARRFLTIIDKQGI